MNIQAIFSDIDGTLFNSQHQITPRTLHAIQRVLAQNIPFILVSARPPLAITPAIELMGKKQMLVAFNGALILNENLEALSNITLEANDTEQLVQLLENEADVYPNYYCGMEWYSSDPSNYWTNREGEITNLRASVAPQKLTKVNKILVLGEADKILALQKRLRTQFSHLHIHRSSPNYLEITSAEATKSKAVDFLAKRLNVSAENIMAFGDNFNDLDMLLYVKNSVAMGNAPEEVKNQARFITASNDEDGIGKFLEQTFSFITTY